MPLSPLIFNTVLEVLANAIIQYNTVKRIQIEKEEIKLSLFTDNMIIYVENPKELTKNFLELISDYGILAGYKVNIKKSIVGIPWRSVLSLLKAWVQSLVGQLRSQSCVVWHPKK